MEPRLVRAHIQLAVHYAEQGDFERAAERYRKVIELRPDDSAALNNLAYLLAEDLGRPGEALPLADRAFRLARDSAPIIDTLAWVHHLSGDHRAAAFFIDQAIVRAPALLDARMHAAAIYAALGNAARARAELMLAERIDATVAERDDFKALAARLQPR
jgi:tetratricopeptide (TPR) repeat protein